MVVCEEVNGDHPEVVYGVPAFEELYIFINSVAGWRVVDWVQVPVPDSGWAGIWPRAVADTGMHADYRGGAHLYDRACLGPDSREQEDTDGYAVPYEEDGVWDR